MELSILASTKKILGIAPEYLVYDEQVITHINSAFSILDQLDLGQTPGFTIQGYDETWFDYTTDTNRINQIKNFIFLKTRLLFDPPTTSFALTALEKQVDEVQWRLSAVTPI